MKKLQALFCALLVCTLLLSGLPRTASAAYPARPVTIIIPFGPGGAVDIAARILAEYFQNKHQITLNIVCKAGGAGAPPPLFCDLRRRGVKRRAGTSPAPTSKRRKTARRKRNPGCRGGKNSFGNCGNFWAFFSSNR